MLFRSQYQAGTVAYTTVVTAQTTALSAEQNLINVRLSRLNASATLVTALGGGWRDTQLPAFTPVAGANQKTPAAPAAAPAAPAAPATPPRKRRWWPF